MPKIPVIKALRSSVRVQNLIDRSKFFDTGAKNAKIVKNNAELASNYSALGPKDSAFTA